MMRLVSLLTVVAAMKAERMVFPIEEWEVVAPSKAGVDAAVMADALAYMESKSFEDKNSEVMIIRRGRVIYAGEAIEKAHNIWSCSKSITSTVLGLLVEEGKLSLDTPVASVLPELREHYPTMTFRHLTTMTSGYNAVGASRWDEKSEDWSHTPYVPDRPLFATGTEYAYWDEGMMLLGRALTRVAGQTLASYFAEHVGESIGLGTFEWYTEGEIDGIPINNGCTNVIVNADQFARIGHLFLNRGEWDGEQVLPLDWVEQATTVQVPETVPVAETDRKSAKGSGAYGFNWWVNGGESPMPDSPPRTYYASGLNHNVCFVIPEWEMVVIRMGVDGNPPEGKHVVWNEFLKRLGPGISR